MSSTNPEPLVQGTRSEKRRGVFVLFAAVAVIAAGIAFWHRPDRAAIQRELDAKNELAGLGALVVMDAGRTHVNSVNLATLKSPDSLDRAVELLPALQHLHSLNVDGTAFGDEHAIVVGQLDRLQDLVLNNTPISDAALKELEGLSRLKTIHLADTSATNAGMQSLGQLHALNIVDISGTKVSNLELLAELPELTWLVAKRLRLDATGIAALGKCRSLGRLSLNDSTTPPEAVEELAREKPNLTIDR
jgi:hypothetical protein